MKRAERDDICPNCGFPLPEGESLKRCPNCGRSIESEDDVTCHLTIFGCGVFGATAGGFCGAAWALTFPPGDLRRSMMVLLPLGCSIAGGILVGWLRRHIAPEHHAGFEQMIISAAMGAVLATFAAISGVTNPTALALVGVGTTLLLRRWIAPRLTRELNRETD